MSKKIITHSNGVVETRETFYTEETVNQLKQQLTEKQNTIDEINKEFVQAVHDWKALCAEKDKEISKLQASCQQVKTQLAIQELEKVREWLEPKYFDYEQINYLTRIIDNQIKELKGE